MGCNSFGVWSDGAMVLGKLPVPGGGRVVLGKLPVPGRPTVSGVVGWCDGAG